MRSRVHGHQHLYHFAPREGKLIEASRSMLPKDVAPVQEQLGLVVSEARIGLLRIGVTMAGPAMTVHMADVNISGRRLLWGSSAAAPDTSASNQAAKLAASSAPASAARVFPTVLKHTVAMQLGGCFSWGMCLALQLALYFYQGTVHLAVLTYGLAAHLVLSVRQAAVHLAMRVYRPAAHVMLSVKCVAVAPCVHHLAVHLALSVHHLAVYTTLCGHLLVAHAAPRVERAAAHAALCSQRQQAHAAQRSTDLRGQAALHSASTLAHAEPRGTRLRAHVAPRSARSRVHAAPRGACSQANAKPCGARFQADASSALQSATSACSAACCLLASACIAASHTRCGTHGTVHHRTGILPDSALSEHGRSSNLHAEALNDAANSCSVHCIPGNAWCAVRRRATELQLTDRGLHHGALQLMPSVWLLHCTQVCLTIRHNTAQHCLCTQLCCPHQVCKQAICVAPLEKLHCSRIPFAARSRSWEQSSSCVQERANNILTEQTVSQQQTGQGVRSAVQRCTSLQESWQDRKHGNWWFLQHCRGCKSAGELLQCGTRQHAGWPMRLTVNVWCARDVIVWYMRRSARRHFMVALLVETRFLAP
jgi:hypothetical protein